MKGIWKVVSVIVVVLISSVRCECPPPFVQLETGCYYFSSEVKDWWDAADSCRQHDAVLAAVESAEEDAILIKQVTEFDRPFWLGASDGVKEGRWVWEMTGNPFLYTGWESDQPNQGEEGKCLVYWKYSEYKWHDGRCDMKLSYICEMDQHASTASLKDAEDCRDSCYHLLAKVFSETGNLPIQSCFRNRERDDECGPPFVQLATGCYFFSSQELNWWEAAESCRNINSVLATVDTLEEDEAIKMQVRKLDRGKPFSLGAFDIGREGRWLWESTLKPLVYTAWDVLVSKAGVKYHVPDNYGGNEHCLQLIDGATFLISESRFKWNDAPCDQKFPYVCKRISNHKPSCPEVHIHTTASSISSTNPVKNCNCLADNNINKPTLK